MSDQTPPGDAFPPPMPSPDSTFPPPTPPGPALPPPSTPPTYAPYSPPPRRAGRRVGLVIGIVAASALVVVGLGVAGYFIAERVVESMDASGGDERTAEILPLVEGSPGPAVAETPLECPESCFELETFGDIGLSSDTYAEMGFDQTEWWGDYEDSTPRKEYSYAARGWDEGEGAPDECFVTNIRVPVAVPIGTRPEDGGTIGYLGYYLTSNDESSLQESARLFDDSASAEAHMSSLSDMVSQCSTYEMGSGAEYWTADVTAAPAFDLPPSVAAVGWVEDSPFESRYYSADLQRGNIVVRVSLGTYGDTTEESFRDYVEKLAVQLDELPVG
ncbi:hypothetical protein M2152_000845 [Microbacteriaceae bacterium SG_E_30_P1]|uniref:Uncharacterized protein n=1 Tax=Antiquaquibacter oligotrophicus TaxID=2880260 RepID=A0ABT6KKX1_9MICO|nr:hypothetical protein [Antiquaquibacter oligotrophicus]MDH6180663.1 hypothetical protein [Antiquaquibacter oligotrophicus]UDF13609.1 hypothetical protein LH407_01790 [Antiquaquibacter oligotrophicus]